MDLFFVYSFIQMFSVSISAKDLYIYLSGYICVCVIKELKKKKTVWVSYYCFAEKSSFCPCIWTLASWWYIKRYLCPFSGLHLPPAVYRKEFGCGLRGVLSGNLFLLVGQNFSKVCVLLREICLMILLCPILISLYGEHYLKMKNKLHFVAAWAVKSSRSCLVLVWLKHYCNVTPWQQRSFYSPLPKVHWLLLEFLLFIFFFFLNWSIIAL